MILKQHRKMRAVPISAMMMDKQSHRLKSPTFTPVLLRKDMDLGLSAAKNLGVPMPVAAAARECVQSIIGNGHVDCDFAALILQQAANSGLDIKSEDVDVGTGL